MSLLPPPAANLVPLAKSAPLKSAYTNFGISPGSAEPSASTMAMTSPVAASNPQASAFPFPRRVCCTTRTSGRSWRATATVSSTECPSTTITSWTSGGSREKTYGRFLASFNVGTTTDTRGHGRSELA
jgi:hypothetical protein